MPQFEYGPAKIEVQLDRFMPPGTIILITPKGQTDMAFMNAMGYSWEQICQHLAENRLASTVKNIKV